MPKPELEFFEVATIAWTAVDERVPGLSERILAREGDSPAATRLPRFEPGTDTTPAGGQEHPFWEEVYILDGSLHDLSLGQTFPKGTYACRSPGMRHGPWLAPEGCLTFEVRYSRERP